jgi:hypothetical protein
MLESSWWCDGRLQLLLVARETILKDLVSQSARYWILCCFEQLFELIYGCKVCSLSAIQVFVCGNTARVHLQFSFPLLLLACTFIQFLSEVAPMFDCVHVSHLHRTWIWLDLIWRSDALQTSISQLHCLIALLTLCCALAMFSVWFLRCHCDLVDSW